MTMNHVRIRRIFRASLVFALVLTSFVWSGLAAAAPAAHGGSGNRSAGAVYALTNAPTGNEVVVWNRADDGSLTPAGSYATGGLGSGAGLGSQGAIILSEDNRWLFAVNAGSNDISSFQVEGQGLKLISRVASGGTLPTSLTVYDDLLHLLNADGRTGVTGDNPSDMALSKNSQYLYARIGRTGSISAFEVQSNGNLKLLAGASGLPANSAGLAAR
jgi:6-phosphogluconolactonase